MPLHRTFAYPVIGGKFVGGGWDAPPPEELALPDVASSTRLLDLQADALALSDGDPVATWSDASGLAHHFTQTGSARPTYRAGGGTPYVEFDGVNDQMIGQNWAALDNLDSFTVFVVMSAGNGSRVAPIGKVNVDVFVAGWVLDSQCTAGYIYVDNDNQTAAASLNLFQPDVKAINVFELLNRTTAHFYVNGDNTNEIILQVGNPANYSNPDAVRLGNVYNQFGAFDFYAVMIYAPAPSPSDRAAIEAWLAAKYGITL